MRIYMPLCLQTAFEPRCVKFSSFVDHLAFAYDIVEELTPERLVELGTYNGVSFFTFCQSVQENRLRTICYAIDSWVGDDHTQPLASQVYDDAEMHNRSHYREFAYLMRMLFNKALEHFTDESIGLLHIDGFHTYEAVRNDFESWYPKVEPGGIILMHDVESRMKDFGAWKFWDDISGDYSSFKFNHGFGLGVIRKPGGGDPEGHLQQLLFDGTPEEHRQLRSLYAHASQFLEARRQAEKFRKKRNKVIKAPEDI